MLLTTLLWHYYVSRTPSLTLRRLSLSYDILNITSQYISAMLFFYNLCIYIYIYILYIYYIYIYIIYLIIITTHFLAIDTFYGFYSRKNIHRNFNNT